MNKKNKIPTRTVKSDDCVIHVGRVFDREKGTILDMGTPYHIHEGEKIEVIPIVSIRQYMAWNKVFSQISNTDIAENALNEICCELSRKIKRWNWTDNDGKKLPQPYKNPDVLKELTEEELIWLSSALVETGEERKNASAPSA